MQTIGDGVILKGEEEKDVWDNKVSTVWSKGHTQ